MIGLILKIAALVLIVLFYPIGLVYALIRYMVGVNIKTWYKYINDLFFKTAISLDQLGNVIIAPLFNDIIIKPSRDRFGNPDETISSVLGKNYVEGKLRVLGKVLCWTLNKLDKNHCIKSIENFER